MKKSITITILILCLALAGCEKKPGPKAEVPLVSEDFPRGELTNVSGCYYIMETEKGFYYNGKTQLGVPGGESVVGLNDLNLRYYDKETGKDIYLCNKPECRHDGNEFCVATNSKYYVLGMQLYSGKIYIAAKCMNDTKVEFKLLAASLDGSDLSEVVTYHSQESMDYVYDYKPSSLLIHRNKAVLQCQGIKDPNIDPVPINGTMIYDLETGQLTQINEEPLSENNVRWENVNAYGDYLFYTARDGRKNIFHRYCLTDGTDKAMTFSVNFVGHYAIMDEDTIYYMQGETNLWVYHIGEDKNQKLPDALTYQHSGSTDNSSFRASTIATDGEYLYFRDNTQYTILNNSKFYRNSVFILTPELAFVSRISMPCYEELNGVDAASDSEASYYFNDMEIHYLGDRIYYTSRTKGDEIFFCDRKDYLLGDQYVLDDSGTNYEWVNIYKKAVVK